MSVYTVQAPIDSLGEPEFERAVFLREGFSWPAFFFGVLWLVWKGLWLTTAIWLAACAGLAWLAMWHLTLGATVLIALALHLLLGLEANALLRRKLAGRRYQLMDVVAAEAREAAERLFFTRISQSQSRAGAAPKDVPPMPSRDTDVLGVFPQPEERG